MPIPNTPKPTYPNVPMAPGVPNVLRQVGAVQNTIVQLVADVGIIANLFSTPQWGLFTAAGASAFANAPGNLLGAILSVLTGATGPSVGEVEYRVDYQISTAPQEQGAFMSYNKVSTPFAGRVTYLVGGTQAQRNAFLQTVASMQQSLTLYSLVMPEITYASCNVTHYDFRRAARNGLTLLAVDIWVEEVRVVGSPQFSNTAQPQGANQVNTGSVQPQQPTPAQATAATTGKLQ